RAPFPRALQSPNPCPTTRSGTLPSSPPFSITYGMNMPDSVHHLTGELINIEAGISLRGIPYRGNTQIVQDLLGGRLDVMLGTGTIALAQINGGTLRGLAVSSRRRFVLEPDISPTRCPASR